MGVGSIPDSPPMPPGDTAEERERAWAAAHPPAAQPSYDSKPQPQQQQFQPQQQQFQQQYTPTGGQGLYPQPVAGIFVRGDRLLSTIKSSKYAFVSPQLPFTTCVV